MKEYKLYTDGAARGNPGNGGYGAVLIDSEGNEKEFSQGFEMTTNNRMEIMAALLPLESLTEPCKITVFSDSAYFVNAFNKGWLDNWIRMNWKRKDPLKNVDLWKRMDKVRKFHSLTFVKVSGHSGVYYNERCDVLATSAADGENRIEDEEYIVSTWS